MSKTDTIDPLRKDIAKITQFCETVIDHITVIKGLVQLRIKEEPTEEILNEINELNNCIIGYMSQLKV